MAVPSQSEKCYKKPKKTQTKTNSTNIIKKHKITKLDYVTLLRLRRDCHIQNLLETSRYLNRTLFDMFLIKDAKIISK